MRTGIILGLVALGIFLASCSGSIRKYSRRDYKKSEHLQVPGK